jgi:hypothetical protein
LIFVPGAVFLAATFVPAALKVLARREIKALAALAGVILIAYAFSN